MTILRGAARGGLKMAATGGSTPKGIKGADAAKPRFVRFFALVQDAASSLGCTFFMWSGEGHEFETDELDGEDLSGWLIPNKLADKFESQWRIGLKSIDESFERYDTFARWSDDAGTISIRFGG